MWTSAEYAALALPAPADHRQVADAMFEATPGYSFGDTTGHWPERPRSGSCGLNVGRNPD